MPTKLSSWKNCVTCEYWAGTRKVASARDHVEYLSDNDKGECLGKYNRQLRAANLTCEKWLKWGVLK